VSLPFTFADQSGRVPASELDDNFTYLESLASGLIIGNPITGGSAGGLLYNNNGVLADLAGALPAITGSTSFDDTFDAAPSVTDFPNVFEATATVDAGGNSDVRLMRHRLIMEGTTGFSRAYGQYNGVELNNTGGTATLPIYALHNYVENFGGMAINFAIPVFGHIVQRGTADIGEGRVYDAGSSVFGTGGGRMPVVIGYNCGSIGDATLVDNVTCFAAGDTSSTNIVVGFQSNIQPGSGKFGFFNATGAANTFRGITTFERLAAVADAGTTNQVLITNSYSGDAGGTTSMRGMSNTIVSTGTANVTSQYNHIAGWTNNLTSGTVAAGFGVAVSLTSANAGATTNLRGISISLGISGSGSITDLALFQADNSTFSSTGAVTTFDVFRANATGNATKVTTYRGFRVVDASASSIVEGFLGQIASGTGKWNLSMTGTADNRIVGNTTLGGSGSPAVACHIAGGGALRLGNAASTGLVAGALAATTNASIVIQDSTGQAYRIPCII